MKFLNFIVEVISCVNVAFIIFSVIILKRNFRKVEKRKSMLLPLMIFIGMAASSLVSDVFEFQNKMFESCVRTIPLVIGCSLSLYLGFKLQKEDKNKNEDDDNRKGFL